MAKLTREEKAMYGAFMEEFPYCWACGWSVFRSVRNRPWMKARLENAHIRGGEGRTHDRRNLARLCNGCHQLNTGEQIRVAGELLPQLELSHMAWLKEHFDPEFFSPEYLSSLRSLRMPDPEAPPKWFQGQWLIHTGG